MKSNQSRSGIELVSPCPFPTTITITPRAPPIIIVIIGLWVECSPMVQNTWVQSLVTSYQRLLKWYSIPPCLTLRNIRYVSRVKRSNPGKGVAPCPTPRCSSYWKGSLLVALDYGRQLYLLLLIIIPSCFLVLFSWIFLLILSPLLHIPIHLFLLQLYVESNNYYITPNEFFTPALAVGLSRESEWQHVSTGLQDSSQYPGCPQQCCSLDSLRLSSDFQLPLLSFQVHQLQLVSSSLWCSMGFFWFSGLSKYFSFSFLWNLFSSPPGQQSPLFSRFSFLC